MFRAGSSLYVTLALTITIGAAFAGGPKEPKPDADARARAQLSEHGIGPPIAGVSDLGPLAEEITAETTVQPLIAHAPFRLPLANGPLEGAPLARDRARAALLVVRRELARYGKHRLKEAGLRRVVLAADLRESGKLISSLPNVAGALLLDGSVPEAFLARLVHHEVFHFLDFADRERYRENDEWRSANGLFAYGEGGRTVRSSRAAELSDEMPGFLTAYAMSAVEEDKAEVFSLLMTRPADVRDRASTDGVVRTKVLHLKTKLERLAPELSDVTSL